MLQVLVTVGAYSALSHAIHGFVQKGDEVKLIKPPPMIIIKGKFNYVYFILDKQVIIIEPFFDCYSAMTQISRGKPVFVPYRPVSSHIDIDH